MSQDKPNAPIVDGTDLYFGIVAARYNNDLVEALIERVRKTLRQSKVAESSIKVLRVPGSAELPYVANMLAQTGEYDCVITLGVIIAGDTPHHEIIAQSTAIALQGIAIQSEVPVINGILTVNNRAQADERVTGQTDRGAEFAQAALEMAWHNVQLGDYLDILDEEDDDENTGVADFPGFGDDDDDDFGNGRSPFHKN
ncbi:MAG: 6,7-dimethyl-8-ribityllumazine synthase [Puniceicoccales bacterium]|jgi:6,7-dimethyl-8-ribityllumazine synthase|nr:6,7-dimethyl-8-ribityllumazine synthase [Puniceicoccales bacterium]